jgi:hypothetical protein
MDDAIILTEGISRIQIAIRRNIDFLNLANDDFVLHVINDSTFERQNIKHYHEINLSLVISC